MYEINFNESDSNAVLRFMGPLTIQNISTIREAFLSVLNKADKLIIHHENVEEYDIAYLQLLIAVQKSMELSGKKLIIKSSNGDAFRAFIENTGCHKMNLVDDDINDKQGGSLNE